MIRPGFRPCVGIMLINRQGLVFVGRRRNKRLVEHVGPGHAWQMPQGGIDEGESPREAAVRELAEETGVTSAVLIGESADWYSYELPVDVSNRAWRGRYKGQSQKWFALRFTGAESEINIASPPGGHKPEFDAWRWEAIDRLVDLIIPFKRAVYESVVRDFTPLAVPAD